MTRRGFATPGAGPQRRADAEQTSFFRLVPRAVRFLKGVFELHPLHPLASGAADVHQVVNQVAKLVRRVFTPPGVPRFVAYFRVSTDKQGVSGLGLEAQREAVSRHVAIAQGVIVAEFQEIESGKRNDRPQIAAALAACRLRRATLVIAKLDRLARNVFFISSLQESGVDFVACDNPHATKLTIQILAAVAEHEREAIAERTKAALAAVKRAIAADGQWVSRRSGRVLTRLGNPRLTPGDTRRARKARTARALSYARDVDLYINEARQAGCTSLSAIARALNGRGIPTPAGGQRWKAEAVKRVLARIERANPRQPSLTPLLRVGVG
jgi:DNA invertase Pin-like site-specific DNA recombinase